MITASQREVQDEAVAMLAIAADLDRQAQGLATKAQAIRALYAPKRRPVKRVDLMAMVKAQGEKR